MPANSSANMQVNSEGIKMEDSGSPVRLRAKGRQRGPPPLSPSTRQQKRNERMKTRVLLLDTFGEWRTLREKLHLKSDRELAHVLLDSYPSEDTSSQTQSTRKTLLLERGLLNTWNNIMAARGFSDDMEFLWFLLSTVAEMPSQGMPGVRSKTSTVSRQAVARRTTPKRTRSDDCVPVKVDYVGPTHMTAGPSHPTNPELIVPTISYRPSLAKKSNSTVRSLLASARSVPIEAGYVYPSNLSSDTDTASESELHREGHHVKEENELETGRGIRTSTSTSQLSFGTVDTYDEQEMNLDDTNLTSQESLDTVGLDIKKEDELESAFPINTKTSQLRFGTDVNEEGEEEINIHNGDNNNQTSQLCSGTLGTDEYEDDETDMDVGNYGNTSTSFPPNSGTSSPEAEKENVLEDRDDFEESEVEFSSSEDDEKGPQSDDSWHPPSERKKITKITKELSEKKTNSKESPCEPERESKPKKAWVCCDCEETFESQSLLYKHKTAVHPKICEVCNKKFPSTNALNVCRRTHMSEEDKANLTPRDSLAFCDLCQGFFARRKLKRHIQLAHDGQQRPDSCCIAMWQDNKSQENGELEGDKPAIKRRRRKRKSGFRRKGEPVLCPWEGCQKTFRFTNQLKRHLATHTGERSYLCYFCGQLFLRQYYLTVHLRIHTGDMPFRCSLCSYSGRQSNCLRWHMKKHHPGHCQQAAGNHKDAESGKEMDTEERVLKTSEKNLIPQAITKVQKRKSLRHLKRSMLQWMIWKLIHKGAEATKDVNTGGSVRHCLED
ncbi:ZNF653 [Branchiostoma lanceolatum]|uniref:ZNF653 protein n=1 Tax=Branchiostoma lanceolatum TaxID=7740 RepID=A0A8J9YRQ5_BRALA|nr:ZNF653 [Branchiostoma lanceolatum]